MKSKFSFLILTLCFLDSCTSIEDSSTQSIQEATNGSGKKAVLFMKYGGATVDNSLQVSIMLVEDKIEDSATGNLFICDDSSGSVGNDDVKIFWKHKDTLEVAYKKRLRVFKSEHQLMRVTILYKQVE